VTLWIGAPFWRERDRVPQAGTKSVSWAHKGKRKDVIRWGDDRKSRSQGRLPLHGFKTRACTEWVHMHSPRRKCVNILVTLYLLYLLFQENKSFGAITICIHPLMYKKPCREQWIFFIRVRQKWIQVVSCWSWTHLLFHGNFFNTRCFIGVRDRIVGQFYSPLDYFIFRTLCWGRVRPPFNWGHTEWDSMSTEPTHGRRLLGFHRNYKFAENKISPKRNLAESKWLNKLTKRNDDIKMYPYKFG
jgi:hypothetical protein